MARRRTPRPPSGGRGLSAWIGILGAALLAASVLPQGWKLLRSWRADDFGWPFVVLNLSGLLLLATRSADLGERAFVAVNLLGALFWLLVLVAKCFPRRDGSQGRLQAVA